MRVMILMLLLLAPVALAQGADWVEFDLKENWQRTNIGFCQNQSQCLVSNSFNTTFDNLPNTYWDGLVNSSFGPKCIESGQFILDHHCDGGNWTSRTRLIAEQLLDLALEQAPSDFALYCDTYDRALNRFEYDTQFGPVEQFLNTSCIQRGLFDAELNSSRTEGCVNNVCALKYGSRVAFGVSLNRPIGDVKSVLKALDLRPDSCDIAINDDGDYDLCSGNVWYNWNTNSLIYVKGVTRLDRANNLTKEFFKRPYDKTHRYVFDNVHNPKVKQLDYTFFNATPDFSYVYMSKDGFEFVYSFKQENVSLAQLDYAAWYFSNIGLPEDVCTRFIKRFDPSTRVSCETQPTPTEFYIVANAPPPLTGFTRRSIVDNWGELTGKLRVVQ